jgi:LuxR family maltose regulon positive regulatory protein
MLARLLIGLDRSRDGRRLDRAVAILDRLLRRAEANGYGARIIEIHVLRAVAYHLLDNTTEAERALDRALYLAEPAGYVRVFADEGEPMAALLQSAFLRGMAPSYARKLLEAMGAAPQAGAAGARLPLGGQAGLDQPLVEELSPRELEILRFLTTSLSSTEIAEQLFVSVNTVRSHIRHIYDKLDVHSRLEAIARAEELTLI